MSGAGARDMNVVSKSLECAQRTITQILDVIGADESSAWPAQHGRNSDVRES